MPSDDSVALSKNLYEGKNLLVQWQDTDIVELVFDVQDSRVNIFNRQTVLELSAALTVLEEASSTGGYSISGLLIRSEKPAFIAGADINEFASVFSQGPARIAQLLRESNDNFNRIESLPFPVVVAIQGFALGGGCEIALAGDYRIATNDVRIGLPETRLGIIPGWGGTVRLPRIVGIETAVEWIATAKEQSAETALKAGVVDGIVNDSCLIASAIKVLRQCSAGQLDYRQRRAQKMAPLQHNATELSLALKTSKAMVAAQVGKHYPAPLAAVLAIEKSASLSRDDALAIETETFIAMAQTPVALSLSGIFLNTQYISKKAKHLAQACKQPLSQAAVIGAGIMGGGVAYQSALKKIPVKIKDINQAGIDLGLAEANKLLSQRVERGRLSIYEMGNVLNRIEPTLSYDGFSGVDIVVEAVVEDPQVKRAVLAEVEQNVATDAVIVSNTSTITINSLAEALQRPENFCGMHFFNPVYAMPLVEVIRGTQTSDQAIAMTLAYANAMGKKAIVVADCPGFLVNRILFPYFAGFAMLLRDGADFQQVDRVMESWGWPMGPAHLLDVVGLDTAIHAEAVMAEGFPSRMQRDFISVAEVLFKAGHLGQKSAQGFYRYQPDKKGKLLKEISDSSNALVKGHVAEPTTFSDEEIIARMMIPMVTELARCLEEGIVASVAEADMALIYGLGFPAFRGGAFRWLDTLGLANFCRMAESYQHLGELYHIPAGMQELSAANTTYYSVPEGE